MRPSRSLMNSSKVSCAGNAPYQLSPLTSMFAPEACTSSVELQTFVPSAFFCALERLFEGALQQHAGDINLIFRRSQQIVE